MKRLLLLLLALFLLLSSCATSTEEFEKSASELFSHSKLLQAGNMALTALKKGSQNQEMEYILAKISGAYDNTKALTSREQTLDEKIEKLLFAEDGTLIAKCEKNEYFFDAKKGIPLSKDKKEYTLINQASLSFEKDGIVFTADSNVLNAYCDEKLLWSVEIDTPVNLFPFTHSRYNAQGKTETCDSVLVVSGSAVNCYDIQSGANTFSKSTDTEIVLCVPSENGNLILATKGFLSTDCTLFSNRSGHPLYASGDAFKLANVFSFDEEPDDIAVFSKDCFVLSNDNKITFYNLVHYDGHKLLNIREAHPSSFADSGNLLAFSTYEYIDLEKHSYFILFDVEKNELYAKIELDFDVEDIRFSDGVWYALGKDAQAEIQNGKLLKTCARELFFEEDELIVNDFKLELDTKSIRKLDRHGNTVGELSLDFELNDSSVVELVDETTLFITEYKNVGKCVLIDLSAMALDAEVEGGVYYMKDSNKILFKKGNSFGIYDHLTRQELIDFGEEFLKTH